MKTTVYQRFEVREGFGPRDVGKLRYGTIVRGDADRELERLWRQGSSAQLFGIRTTDDDGDGERVLLRMLVGVQAA